MKKKYRYRYKAADSERMPQKSGSPKTRLGARLRMILLLVWSAVAVGIYIALAKVSFTYCLWFFLILFFVAFVAYYIAGLRVSKYIREDKGDSEECGKLVDLGKLLLIFMIPCVFIIMYDFLSTTYKIFM